ncbi:MAG: 4-hydroxybenzoate 3-monooxygenase [Hyphomicrobiales bacterium]|nr:4-hydroxybenzoate 3-monooxygenase [Hyphomicrobiales bacterium]
MRTQVGIIGGGPAGLLLSHLLHLEGIESVVLESRSRAYGEGRVRAGLLEQNTVDLLTEAGVGERLVREGLPHDGVQFTFDGRYHRIDMREHTGRRVTIYGQQEVVKDLIAARLAAGGAIVFEAEAREIGGLDTERPYVRYVEGGVEKTLECDYIAGCDGFHGVARGAIPASVLQTFDRIFPFAWLGMLIAAEPPSEELIYSHHPEGFALFSMRAPKVTRAYLQVEPDDDVKNWPAERIWEALRKRLGQHEGLTVHEGELMQVGITPMRSFVTEPMKHGRMFLAGDAAHIVPPTGAKGMNLAIADISVLARAFVAHYKRRDSSQFETYGPECLRRIWRAEHFSWWMTTMLHPLMDASPFDKKRQIAELDTVMNSRAGRTFLAENYAGLPLAPWR